METIIFHTEVSFCLAAYRGFYLNIFQTLGEINNFLEASWKLRGNKAGKKCRSGGREGKKNRGENRERRKGGKREKKRKRDIERGRGKGGRKAE